MKNTYSKILAVTFSLVLSCGAFATGGGTKNDPPQKTISVNDVKTEIVSADAKN